jgi:tetratricopeptide (TPR) repeat protein
METTNAVKKQTISLCMITKDEGNFLKYCIESVKDIVDEVIVADTGSKDNTPEIARENGARVIDLAWEEDFSKARNESIQSAQSDWILVLDADETISSKHLARLKALAQNNECEAYSFEIRNYTDILTCNWQPKTSDWEEGDDFPGFDESHQIRLFRNRKEILFSGIINETIKDAAGKAIRHKNSGMPIHHHGRMRETARTIERKKEFIELVLKKTRVEQDNASTHYELGLLYFECGLYSKATKALEKSLRLEPKCEKALFLLASTYSKRGELVKSEHTLNKLLEMKPSANAYVLLGTIYMDAGETEKALDAFRNALEIDPNHLYAHNRIGLIYTRRRLHRKSIPFFQTALRINPNYIEAKENLAAEYECTLDWQNAQNTYKELLATIPQATTFAESRLKAIEQYL